MKKYLFAAFILFYSCQKTNSQMEVLCKLPKKLKEVSGIQKSTENSFYAIEDSGNGTSLYEIDSDGKKHHEFKVGNAENIDWEDLASDKKGNLYIGDFGNNDNTRNDLCIYKVNPKSAKNGELNADYKVRFHYPEQKKFPPSKKELLYDCEAFFELDGFFYLFTKNRSKGFDGTSLIYKIPNQVGEHKAQLLGSYKTGGNYNSSAITGAAVNPDGSKFVLLSHSRIWLFKDFSGDDFLKGKITRFELNHYSQKEAVCFKDDQTLLITDEKQKSNGGNVYQVNLGKLKTKP